jgi:hypothetical protein
VDGTSKYRTPKFIEYLAHEFRWVQEIGRNWSRHGTCLTPRRQDEVCITDDLPNASNNEAEYEALIHGMKMAKACGATRLKIFGDSQLATQQVMNKCDAVNDNMIAYKEVYNELEKTFDGCEVNHISMLNNDEAGILANIGSQCLPIPPGFFCEEISERSTKAKKVPKQPKKKEKSNKTRGLQRLQRHIHRKMRRNQTKS